MSEARDKALLAKQASPIVAKASAAQRSEAIRLAAQAILDHEGDILAANAADYERSEARGMKPALLDRLFLDGSRLDGIASAMLEVAELPDPLGRVVAGGKLTCGLDMEQVTVPIGVVAMIYEARPNVTADTIALCIRSGNTVVLKGGSAAHDSCQAIAVACREGIAAAGLPADAIQIVDSTDHAESEELMRANGLVDVLIPRGGAALIQSCVRNATVPVIETGVGNCHIYLESTADLDMALPIVINAKTQRPGVCNAAESLLVDADAAERLLPTICKALHEAGVEMVGDEGARAAVATTGIPMGVATEDDWGTEYLDLKISVKCVSGVDEAVAHINRYGTHHSEAIVTSRYDASQTFLDGVDAAAVYVNASTRFTDGGVFGLGCEIGISTQKLHVRGPMGLTALTTTKYLLRGKGEIR